MCFIIIIIIYLTLKYPQISNKFSDIQVGKASFCVFLKSDLTLCIVDEDTSLCP